MLKLIKKELTLAFHPTTAIFLLFTTMVFIPNYPYEVMFYFSALSIFFVCLSARENNDLFFTCTLPIKKEDAAKARILSSAIFQMCQLALAAILIIVKNATIPQSNLAGIDANASLIGMGFIIFGVYNVTFFTMYYKDPKRVGFPFVISAIIIFVIILADIALCFVPPIGKVIDSLEPTYLYARIIVLIVGAIIYAALTFLAVIISSKRLSKVDL